MKIKQEHMGADLTIIGDNLTNLMDFCEIEWKGERHFLFRCSEFYNAIALDNYEYPSSKRENPLTKTSPPPEAVSDWFTKKIGEI